jgi:hypothetical protein
LIGSEFVYWGEAAPKIPKSLQKFVIARPGWDDKFTQVEIDQMVDWVYGLGQHGQVGDPLEWRYERRWR